MADIPSAHVEDGCHDDFEDPQDDKLQTHEEPFTFGVTLQQIDQFHTLLRTITAQSDMVAVCSGKPLDATSLSVLGESIFNAARAVRAIVDEIDTQRLHDGGVDTTG